MALSGLRAGPGPGMPGPLARRLGWRDGYKRPWRPGRTARSRRFAPGDLAKRVGLGPPCSAAAARIANWTFWFRRSRNGQYGCILKGNYA